MKKRSQSDRGDQNDEDNSTEILTSELKRFKLSSTPGEIRFRTDVQELFAIDCIQVLEESSRSIVMLFQDNDIVPSAFQVSVSKYYPHVPPEIICLDYNNQVILNHPTLLQWSAIFTMRQVFEMIVNIRSNFTDDVFEPVKKCEDIHTIMDVEDIDEQDCVNMIDYKDS